MRYVTRNQTLRARGRRSNGGRYDRAVITAHSGNGLVTTVGGETVTPARWWRDPQLLVPIGAGAAYVLVLVLRLPGILSSFYWYGDFPAALRLGDAIFHAGWGHGVQLRDQAGLAPLWIVGLLHQISGSDVAGMSLGAVMMVASIWLMLVTARQVTQTSHAVLVGVLCVAAPPVVAWETLSPLAHGCTLLLTAVCAWQLVTLSQRAVAHAAVASLAVGAVAGACVVSDTLSFAAAVVPWVICASVLAVRRPERRSVLAITAAATCVSAVAIALVAHANGIVANDISAPGLSMRGIGAGLGVAASTLGQMISGAWYRDALPSVIAIAAFVLFTALIYLVARTTLGRKEEASAPRDMYVWFWVLSSAGLITALCATGLGIQTSPVNYQGHYLNWLWFAVAALLPLAVMGLGRRRSIAVGLVACLALLSAAGVARLTGDPFQGPDYLDGAQLTATLTELGVTHGYGGYWESYSVAWHTDQHVSVLPLQSCTDPSGSTGLCRYQYAAPASFDVRPGPTFVIVLRGSCRNDDLCIDASNLAGLPAPESVRTVGLLQVDVYATDVFAGLPVPG
jgi:hypothetical protein